MIGLIIIGSIYFILLDELIKDIDIILDVQVHYHVQLK